MTSSGPTIDYAKESFAALQSLTKGLTTEQIDFRKTTNEDGRPNADTIPIDELAFNWPIQDHVFAMLYSTLKHQAYLPVVQLASANPSGTNADLDIFSSAAFAEMGGNSSDSKPGVAALIDSLSARDARRQVLTSFNLVTAYDLVSRGLDDPAWLMNKASISIDWVKPRLLQFMLLQEEAKNPIVQYNIISQPVGESKYTTANANPRTEEDELAKYRTWEELVMPKTLSGPNPQALIGSSRTDQLNHKEFAQSRVVGLLGVDEHVRKIRQKVFNGDKTMEKVLKEAERCQIAYWGQYSDMCSVFLTKRGWLNKLEAYFLPHLDKKLATNLTVEQRRVKDRRLYMLLHMKPFQFHNFAQRITESLQQYRAQTATMMQRKLCAPTAEIEFQILSNVKADLERQPHNMVLLFKNLFENYFKFENIQLRRVVVPPNNVTGTDQQVLVYRLIMTVGPRGASGAQEDVDADVMAFEQQLFDPLQKNQRPLASGWKFLTRYEKVEEQRPVKGSAMIPMRFARYFGRVDTVYDHVYSRLEKQYCLPRSYTNLPAYSTRIAVASASQSSIDESGESKISKKDPAYVIIELQQKRQAIQDQISQLRNNFLERVKLVRPEDAQKLVVSYTAGNQRLLDELSQIDASMQPLVDSKSETLVAVGLSNAAMVVEEHKRQAIDARKMSGSSSPRGSPKSPAARLMEAQDDAEDAAKRGIQIQSGRRAGGIRRL